MTYPLQPLRIPCGWTVAFNAGLYEVDPEPNLIDEFKEDMLQMKQEHFNRLLDVGWYPEGNMETGEYGLVVHEGDFNGRLLFELSTRDRLHLVAEIERLLVAVSEGRL